MNINNNEHECSAISKGIEIEITSYCGMKCITCVREDLDDYSFITFNTFKDIINLVKEGDYKEIMVSGHGDAFLHPDINEFLEFIFYELPNINIYFMTKGLALKQVHLDKILDLNKMGFNVSLTFSIFSLNKKVYNYLAGGPFFDSFIETLNKVKNRNINFSIEFMISLLTLSELDKFKSFAKSLGKTFSLSLSHNWGGKLNNIVYGNLFDEVKLKDYFTRRKKGDICEIIKYDYLYIDSFGKVFHCSLGKMNIEGLLGKIGDESLESFLNKKKKLNFNKSCTGCSNLDYKSEKSSN